MLTLWKPFTNNGFWNLSPQFDDMLGELTTGNSASSFEPAVEIEEDEDSYKVKLDLPGHNPKDIQVTVENDVLSISSERTQEKREDNRTYHRSEVCYGSYARSFSLPTAVDGAKTSAQYEGGVLSLSLPKREESKPRSVKVKISS